MEINHNIKITERTTRLKTAVLFFLLPYILLMHGCGSSISNKEAEKQIVDWFNNITYNSYGYHGNSYGIEGTFRFPEIMTLDGVYLREKLKSMETEITFICDVTGTIKIKGEDMIDQRYYKVVEYSGFNWHQLIQNRQQMKEMRFKFSKFESGWKLNHKEASFR